MYAMLYLRDLGRGPRWYAYNNGVIGSWETRAEAEAELRSYGWNF